MAIVSKGYEGTVNYAMWALVASYAGAEYGVTGNADVAAKDSFGLSVGPADREVRVAPGRAVGQGIVDDSDTEISLVATPVGAGSRWDLVCLRRNWTAKTTTPVLIPGDLGGIATVPVSSMVRGIGVVDDQPVGLVRFAAGQSAAQEFIDLRVWYGAGGAAAKSGLVRQFLQRIGSRVWIQGVTWVFGFKADGNPGWVPDSPFVGSSQPPYADGQVWVKVP